MSNSHIHNPDMETIPVTVSAEFALKTPTVEGEILELTPRGVILKISHPPAETEIDLDIDKAKLISKPVNLKIPGFGFFEGIVISIEDDIATIHFIENHKVMVNLILDKFNSDTTHPQAH